MKSYERTSLVVLKWDELPKYGFVQRGSVYEYFNKRQDRRKTSTLGDIYLRKGSMPCISSKSNETLEVICKLYKDGVITFKNTGREDAYNARIAKLEAEIVKLKQERDNGV